MKTSIIYLIQVMACSGILYGYYHFFLRNKRFHTYNRFYLLLSMAVSLLIPFLQIPVYFTAAQMTDYYVYDAIRIVNGNLGEDTVINSPVSSTAHPVSPFTLAILFYSLVAALVLTRVLFALLRIKKLRKHYPSERLQDIRFIHTSEPDAPFSFFRNLFWNTNMELNSEKGQQVFRHEWFHIHQKHTRDILWMEFLSVFFWINPFFYLMKREVKAIHEFLADEFALQETESWEYAELLLQQALQTRHNLLVTPFFHNQIKRRIAMITSLSKKTSYQYLRKVMVLPVAVIAIGLFAFKLKEKDINSPFYANDPVTIVVDAGHGGTDPGAKSIDGKVSEAGLNLEIAKAIQELAPAYNIKVVMTREDANFPGNATNKNDGLKKRTEISSGTNPAVFLSIHLNRALVNSTKSGFEVSISGKNNNYKNTLLATALLKSINGAYKTSMVIKRIPNVGIWVLDHNETASVLLECGYINNNDDLSFISNRENQREVAKRILEGVVRYTQNTPGEGSPAVTDTVPPKKDPDAGKVFTKTDIDASFPGGEKQWQLYLNNQLNTEIPSKNGAPKGTYPVVVQFIVKRDGSVSGMLAKTHYGYGLEEEVMKLISNGPKWEPAIQNGKKVNAYKTQLVTIVIPGGPEKDKSGKTITNDNIVFSRAEIPASFIGGQQAWQDYLRKSLNANVPVDSGAAAGTYTVKIQFIVKADGTITDIRPLTHFGFGMETECMRVIKNVQQWEPATQNGRKVNAYRQQPITFVIEEETPAGKNG